MEQDNLQDLARPFSQLINTVNAGPQRSLNSLLNIFNYPVRRQAVHIDTVLNSMVDLNFLIEVGFYACDHLAFTLLSYHLLDSLETFTDCLVKHLFLIVAVWVKGDEFLLT